MNTEILFCPSCKGDLKKHKDHAQGVKYCSECKEIWYILNTGKLSK